ncbi:hypothetical protein GCM10022222_23400 [Amycolatopsis ultiminotia]|uniref:Uncharacterized protein n=1 Tax=Amycolatopsis ultiminotia TaxID=543629 RepID=A0ABP6VSU6_9PSEU
MKEEDRAHCGALALDNAVMGTTPWRCLRPHAMPGKAPWRCPRPRIGARETPRWCKGHSRCRGGARDRAEVHKTPVAAGAWDAVAAGAWDAVAAPGYMRRRVANPRLGA